MHHALRSMVVHVDGTPRCAVRLLLAHQLARVHEARLTAVYGTTPPLVDTPYLYAAGALAAQGMQDAWLAQLHRARNAFDASKASRSGEVGWAELNAEPVVHGFAQQALYADLMVLGQHDPDTPQEVPADFAESVLIESGKPGIVVPHAGHFTTVGEKVMVAWKPSAESARAVSASMPLLRHAREVHVIAWGAGLEPRCEGDRLDLERYLGLHGVNATLHHQRTEPANTGDALLSMAEELSADLMVMGCYGHSRARELVLGGVTRTVLRSMTVPVLMSH